MLTILWHDQESAGYTDYLKPEWLNSEGVRLKITHLVVGPRSGRDKAMCDVSVNGALVECNYEPYAKFNTAHNMFLGVTRIEFVDSTRQHVTRVLWKDVGKKRFAQYSPTIGYVAGDPEELDELVAQSGRLTQEERRKRLAKASKKPARTQVVSTAFLRNPDVVASVLFRAHGVCECCRQPAPFRRASDGAPYLEVHHRVRLADGGEDTVKNAIALCPNCHRKAHYG